MALTVLTHDHLTTVVIEIVLPVGKLQLMICSKQAVSTLISFNSVLTLLSIHHCSLVSTLISLNSVLTLLSIHHCSLVSTLISFCLMNFSSWKRRVISSLVPRPLPDLSRRHGEKSGEGSLQVFS